MRMVVSALSAVGLLLLGLPSPAAVRPHHHTSTHALVRHTATSRSHHAFEHAVYPSISSERATEIQSALIRQGYLTGDPTGSWDAASVAAMQRLQGDNGWQTKLVPDARALIKLGLGPSSDISPSAPPALTTTARN